MVGFGFKDEGGCPKIWLGVARLFTVGERCPAFHSDVMPSVGVVTKGVCLLFGHAPGVVRVGGCFRAAEGKSFRTPR